MLERDKARARAATQWPTIGRFGLGFKSLLALGGTIDLFSRSVSIRFDPEACQRTISEALELPPEEMPPGLRMAEVISFEDQAVRDEHLADIGSWATTSRLAH